MENKTLVGLGIGLLAGARHSRSYRLLFAPKSGKETREILKDRTGTLLARLRISQLIPKKR
jgi:gas vesicle protein